MTIETVDDLVEQLADWLGVYGGCKSNGDEGCEYDENTPFCCRVGFSGAMKERIEKAVDNDRKLQELDINP